MSLCHLNGVIGNLIGWGPDCRVSNALFWVWRDGSRRRDLGCSIQFTAPFSLTQFPALLPCHHELSIFVCLFHCDDSALEQIRLWLNFLICKSNYSSPPLNYEYQIFIKQQENYTKEHASVFYKYNKHYYLSLHKLLIPTVHNFCVEQVSSL